MIGDGSGRLNEESTKVDLEEKSTERATLFIGKIVIDKEMLLDSSIS